jgi:hypothetical protein
MCAICSERCCSSSSRKGNGHGRRFDSIRVTLICIDSQVHSRPKTNRLAVPSPSSAESDLQQFLPRKKETKPECNVGIESLFHVTGQERPTETRRAPCLEHSLVCSITLGYTIFLLVSSAKSPHPNCLSPSDLAFGTERAGASSYLQVMSSQWCSA